jgi:GGDEF domain-containing protein
MKLKESCSETIIEGAAAANNLSPYFVCIHKNSIIISVDEGGTQLLGYKYPGELIGKSIFSFLSSTNEETITTRIAAIEQGVILQGSIMSFIINGIPLDFQVSSENTIFNGESAIKTSLRFAQKASQLAEDFQSTIQAMNIEHKNSKVSEIVTISIGLSCVTPMNPNELKLILEFADRALYKAKQNGRNRIDVCEHRE